MKEDGQCVSRKKEHCFQLAQTLREIKVETFVYHRLYTRKSEVQWASRIANDEWNITFADVKKSTDMPHITLPDDELFVSYKPLNLECFGNKWMMSFCASGWEINACSLAACLWLTPAEQCPKKAVCWRNLVASQPWSKDNKQAKIDPCQQDSAQKEVWQINHWHPHSKTKEWCKDIPATRCQRCGNTETCQCTVVFAWWLRKPMIKAHEQWTISSKPNKTEIVQVKQQQCKKPFFMNSVVALVLHFVLSGWCNENSHAICLTCVPLMTFLAPLDNVSLITKQSSQHWRFSVAQASEKKRKMPTFHHRALKTKNELACLKHFTVQKASRTPCFLRWHFWTCSHSPTGGVPSGETRHIPASNAPSIAFSRLLLTHFRIGQWRAMLSGPVWWEPKSPYGALMCNNGLTDSQMHLEHAHVASNKDHKLSDHPGAREKMSKRMTTHFQTLGKKAWNVDLPKGEWRSCFTILFNALAFIKLAPQFKIFVTCFHSFMTS